MAIKQCCSVAPSCQKRKYRKVKSGIVGPTGPTGPTGPSGEITVARTTTTLDSSEMARVVSTHEGNVNYLDFFIPQGKTGKTGTVKAGNTIQVQSSEVARVEDRFEADIHFLDFYIPQGEMGLKGDKGDKGDTGQGQMVSVDCTYTVASTEPARVEETEMNNTKHLAFYIPRGEKGDTGPQGEMGPQGIQGIQGIKGDQGEQGPVGPQGMQGVAGPKGEQGPKGDVGPKGDRGETGAKGEQGIKGDKGEKGDTGATGPTGPQGPKGDQGKQGIAGPSGEKGELPNINATIYSESTQKLEDGDTIMLDKVLTNNGMRVVGNAIIVQEEGTYLVAFSVNSGNVADVNDSVAVAINGAEQEATSRQLSGTISITSISVLNLKANDSITLKALFTLENTINNFGAPSATLTVVKVSG